MEMESLQHTAGTFVGAFKQEFRELAEYLFSCFSPGEKFPMADVISTSQITTIVVDYAKERMNQIKKGGFIYDKDDPVLAAQMPNIMRVHSGLEYTPDDLNGVQPWARRNNFLGAHLPGQPPTSRHPPPLPPTAKSPVTGAMPPPSPSAGSLFPPA